MRFCDFVESRVNKDRRYVLGVRNDVGGYFVGLTKTVAYCGK